MELQSAYSPPSSDLSVAPTKPVRLPMFESLLLPDHLVAILTFFKRPVGVARRESKEASPCPPQRPASARRRGLKIRKAQAKKSTDFSQRLKRH